MKAFHEVLCLFSLLCCLNRTPTAAIRIFHFGPCRVSMSMTEIRAGFNAIKANISSDRCCITHHLFDFYVEKVFKHCQTEDSFINRKISSIANSFLSVKRTLGQCREQNKCMCGQESSKKLKQILENYEGLNVTSAAIKSLGELDILLDWMEKSP